MQLLDGVGIILSNYIYHFLKASLAGPQFLPLWRYSFIFQVAGFNIESFWEDRVAFQLITHIHADSVLNFIC